MMLTPERAISLLNNGDHLRIIHREEICKLIHDLLKQLAAANADLKALKSENELLRHKAAGHDTTMLRTELAAANAELAAEREAKEKANQHYSEQYVRTCRAEQRADIAEEKAKRLIKKLTYNTPTFRDGKCDEELLTINENELVPLKSCMCDRLKQAEAKLISHAPDGHQYSNAQFIAMRQKAEQAEAENKRMQAAINRYVIGNIELLDALKAALEVNP